jgi:integrase/recombinase XerD
MVRLMLNAGLRVAEVVNLKVRDLEPDSGRLMVRQGKGGKDRAVWVSDADVKLVEGYLAARPGAHGSQDHIFLNRFERKLTTRYLQWMLREYGEAAGIAKQLHPHMLRHTFATDLLRATKNLRLVQKALGHSDVKTTVIYTHIVDDELQDAMQNFRGGRE